MDTKHRVRFGHPKLQKGDREVLLLNYYSRVLEMPENRSIACKYNQKSSWPLERKVPSSEMNLSEPFSPQSRYND